MTDKEFKELCEWAEKKYPENIISDRCFSIDMLLTNHNMLKFNKLGRIDMYKNIGDLSIRFNLEYNRTAKQMKAIIENLL